MGAILVAGTSSSAGKSVLATALCASLRRRGVRVAPFKAQNMSNNARVAEGGEIGAAQYFQAVAAGVVPRVDHNPVLLKPEGEMRSQVVLCGQVDRTLTEMAWRERSPYLWEVARDSYDRVAASAQVVVIEGAGSPAEINLADVDLANLRIGRHAAAPMIVVCDIDRGGAFAHLYGTWALLDAADRDRVAGCVLNRFRGDPALLAPGPAASNLDEWAQLRTVSDCRWATRPGHLADAELIVLPGSKRAVTDLDWLRSSDMDVALADARARRVPMLAVCGGAQVLGTVLSDTDGVESPGEHRGLGLLPARTTLAPHKLVRHVARQFRADLPAPWHALAGLRVAGYEVHFGETMGEPRVLARRTSFR